MSGTDWPLTEGEQKFWDEANERAAKNRPLPKSKAQRVKASRVAQQGSRDKYGNVPVTLPKAPWEKG